MSHGICKICGHKVLERNSKKCNKCGQSDPLLDIACPKCKSKRFEIYELNKCPWFMFPFGVVLAVLKLMKSKSLTCKSCDYKRQINFFGNELTK